MIPRSVLLPVLLLSAGPGLIAGQPPGPMGLDAAIRLALERNLTIKVEAYDPSIARANLLTAYGQFEPVFTAGRSYARTYDQPLVPEPLSGERYDTNNYNVGLGGLLPWGLNYTIGGSAENLRGPLNGFVNTYSTFEGVNITQPLLRGFGLGANLANLRVAKADRSISDWQYRQTLIDTVASVVLTYSNLVFAHDQVRIAQASHDLAASLVAQNEKALKDGFMAQSDVITARAEMAAREDAILTTERSLHIVENQLRELIGGTRFPADDPLPIDGRLVLPETAVDPAADYETALASRPDYQAARLGIVVNRAQDTAARNGLLPQVDFVGGYGYNGLSQSFAASRQMVAERLYPSYSAGLALTIPLAFAQARGRARAARLTLQRSEADLRRMEADIALSVANGAGQIETAQRRVLSGRNAYELANRALDDELKKLRDGRSTTLAVIQARQNLINAENILASATAAERSAMTNYDHLLGLTLKRYHIVFAEPAKAALAD